MPVNRLGTNGCNNEGSLILVNSITDGNRHPTVPPTILLAHWDVAYQKLYFTSSGLFSHTKPVLLSRTASLLNSAKTVKRVLLGRFLSQFCAGVPLVVWFAAADA